MHLCAKKMYRLCLLCVWPSRGWTIENISLGQGWYFVPLCWVHALQKVCVCVCVWKRAQEGSKRIMVPHTSYVSDWDKGPLGSMQRCVFVYVWIVCLCVWPSLSLYTHSLSLDLFTVSPHTHACRITAYLRHESFTQRHSDTGTVRQLSDWPAASRHFQYVFYCYDMKSFSKSLKKYRFFFLKLFFLIWLRPLSYNVLDPGQFELIQWNV